MADDQGEGLLGADEVGWREEGRCYTFLLGGGEGEGLSVGVTSGVGVASGVGVVSVGVASGKRGGGQTVSRCSTGTNSRILS